MDEQSKIEFANEAKGLAKWFAIDLTIKLFGVVIYEYHFPPKKS